MPEYPYFTATVWIYSASHPTVNESFDRILDFSGAGPKAASIHLSVNDTYIFPHTTGQDVLPVTVINDGGSAVSPSITIAGPGAGGFNLSSATISSIAAGSAGTFNVTLTDPSVASRGAVVTVSGGGAGPKIHLGHVKYAETEGDYYVSPGGTGDGSTSGSGASGASSTLTSVLNRIKTAGVHYDPGDYKVINISGTITADAGTANGMIEIRDTTGSEYPAIILNGTGTINANAGSTGNKRVLYVRNATVILGPGITLTNGRAAADVSATTGSAIAGNTGGGALVYSYSAEEHSALYLHGVISGNQALAAGGGVAVTGPGSSLTLMAGSVEQNSVIPTAANGTGPFTGGGVAVLGGSFVMRNGAVYSNTILNTNLANHVAYGGGVFVMGRIDLYNLPRSSYPTGSFIMNNYIQSAITACLGSGLYVGGKLYDFGHIIGTANISNNTRYNNTDSGHQVYQAP
jgi:hypothetical protein